MAKRILITTLIVLLTGSLAAGYFYHAGKYAASRCGSLKCSDVKITILDSASTRLISCAEVLDIVTGGKDKVIGAVIDSINVDRIEKRLADRGEISSCEVYATMGGDLNVELTQRRPAIRFETAGASYYCDRTGYIFPILCITDVPIVTGKVPLSVKEGYKGRCGSDKESKWLEGMLALTEYIERNSFWHKQIEQIDVESGGDIVLYTRAGDQKVIFGDASDIDWKFRKLAAYYKGIVPEKGADKYSTVNLKFTNQIVCK